METVTADSGNTYAVRPSFKEKYVKPPFVCFNVLPPAVSRATNTACTPPKVGTYNARCDGAALLASSCVCRAGSLCSR